MLGSLQDWDCCAQWPQRGGLMDNNSRSCDAGGGGHRNHHLWEPWCHSTAPLEAQKTLDAISWSPSASVELSRTIMNSQFPSITSCQRSTLQDNESLEHGTTPPFPTTQLLGHGLLWAKLVTCIHPSILSPKSQFRRTWW